jgi:hypothetical protein
VVGWICAIATEYIAAQELLDKEYKEPNFLLLNDTNNYILGEMGKYNVIIAVLPDGKYRTATVASIATNMLNSFPNV